MFNLGLADRFGHDFSMDFTSQGFKDRAMAKQKEAKFLGIPGRLAFVATSYAFTDPRAQTVWSLAVFAFGLQNMFFTGMMGKDRNSLIHTNTDLLTRKGGTIITQSRQPLDNVGVGDDGNTTGNEAQIKRRNMSTEIHERANSTVSAGRLSEQLTASEFREDSRIDLGEWISEAMEDDISTSAAGLYNVNSSSNAIQTINESYPTSDRIHFGGQNAAGTLATAGGTVGASFGTDALLSADTSANNRFGTTLMELIKRKMIAASPRFRPVIVRDVSKMNPDDVRSSKFSGPVLAKIFIVLVDPLQIKDIRAETGDNAWKVMQQNAQIRGNLNPIFTGAEFYHDGMLVFSYDRIHRRTGAGSTTLAEGFELNAARDATVDAVASGRTVARALFMAAQAIHFGWALKPSWSEDFVDNDKPKIKVAMLYGVKRINYNAHGTSTPTSDESIFVVDTEVQVDA